MSWRRDSVPACGPTALAVLAVQPPAPAAAGRDARLRALTPPASASRAARCGKLWPERQPFDRLLLAFAARRTRERQGSHSIDWATRTRKRLSRHHHVSSIIFTKLRESRREA